MFDTQHWTDSPVNDLAGSGTSKPILTATKIEYEKAKQQKY